MIRSSGYPESEQGMHYETCCADRIKIVWWDGTGICLYAKRLDKHRFCWPRLGDSTVKLGHAQLLALVEGMDWTRVRTVRIRRPQSMR